MIDQFDFLFYAFIFLINNYTSMEHNIEDNLIVIFVADFGVAGQLTVSFLSSDLLYLVHT